VCCIFLPLSKCKLSKWCLFLRIFSANICKPASCKRVRRFVTTHNSLFLYANLVWRLIDREAPYYIVPFVLLILPPVTSKYSLRSMFSSSTVSLRRSFHVRYKPQALSVSVAPSMWGTNLKHYQSLSLLPCEVQTSSIVSLCRSSMWGTNLKYTQFLSLLHVRYKPPTHT
jgi:hypothetical protein